MSTSTTSEARGLLFHAAVVTDLLDGLLDACLAPVRLSPREFEIATVLVTRGPQPPGEIATVTGVPAPSVSRMLAAMKRDGLVVEEAHPSDGRSRIIALTEAGADAFREAQAAFMNLYDAVAETLGAGVDGVDGAVRRLEWALRKVAGVPVPDPLPADGGEEHAISYAGPRLNGDDQAEILDYIEWIRRRGELGRRRRR